MQTSSSSHGGSHNNCRWRQIPFFASHISQSVIHGLSIQYVVRVRSSTKMILTSTDRRRWIPFRGYRTMSSTRSEQFVSIVTFVVDCRAYFIARDTIETTGDLCWFGTTYVALIIWLIRDQNDDYPNRKMSFASVRYRWSSVRVYPTRRRRCHVAFDNLGNFLIMVVHQSLRSRHPIEWSSHGMFDRTASALLPWKKTNSIFHVGLLALQIEVESMDMYRCLTNPVDIEDWLSLQMGISPSPMSPLPQRNLDRTRVCLITWFIVNSHSSGYFTSQKRSFEFPKITGCSERWSEGDSTDRARKSSSPLLHVSNRTRKQWWIAVIEMGIWSRQYRLLWPVEDSLNNLTRTRVNPLDYGSMLYLDTCDECSSKVSQ